MSGGRFDFDQYKIGHIAEIIERQIEDNDRPKTKQELKVESWYNDDWYEQYPEDLSHYIYSDDVIEKFKEAVIILRKAEIYAHRIDWLLTGDVGDESFLKRLEEDLEKLNK
jgi:isocitrate dehydrogenase kinase/phosphatase